VWLVGLDVDDRLLAEARERLDARRVRAELVGGDVREMPFADGSFDVVVDFGTCYHIDRPGLALREVARVLRDGGLFVHETPVSQLLAHPVRSTSRRLPWAAVPELARGRTAVLWSRRILRVASSSRLAA
jgi:ubiquinone/menaquinone biosynthesis C-methylase UbiE